MSVFEYMWAAFEPQEEEQVNEQTVAIIKPDVVRMGGKAIAQVLGAAADGGLHPIKMWMGEVPRSTWEEFYGEHRDKPFFDELVGFMASGPSVFLVLEGPVAIKHWRVIMGATDPLKAKPMTLRRQLGTGGPANAVHGSDSPESFEREHALLFTLPN